MPGVLQNSALGERVSNFILKERETDVRFVVSPFSPFSENHFSYLGNNNLLFQDLHCIICAAGFLSHQNHLPKRAFTQQLQIVKVIHCLSMKRETSEWAPARYTTSIRRSGSTFRLWWLVDVSISSSLAFSIWEMGLHRIPSSSCLASLSATIWMASTHSSLVTRKTISCD